MLEMRVRLAEYLGLCSALEMRSKGMQMFKNRLVILALFVAVLIGTGAFTFRYAEGFSYFSTDPKACANCHIMNAQYDSWQKSSHHGAATCVDCHLPHTFLAKYVAKAENGYHHSKGFTLQDFHEPIMIKGKNKRILQHNCVECHGDMVHELFNRDASDPDAVSCVHCHATVGHGALPTSIGGADRGEQRERESHE
jgi:cytochrome c nitrite reductase small subunit